MVRERADTAYSGIAPPAAVPTASGSPACDRRNQPTLHDDIRQVFSEGLDNDFVGIEHHSHCTEEKGYGRVEKRVYHIAKVTEQLAEQHADWDGLGSIGMVYSERQACSSSGTKCQMGPRGEHAGTLLEV